MLSGTQKFGLFMALSVVVHAVLLSGWTPALHYSLSDHVIQTLDLELSKSSPASHKQEKFVTHKNAEQAKPEVIKAESDITQIMGHGDITETLTEKTESFASTEVIRNKIANEFARFFYYPDAARRRNWHGEVVLEFTLLRNGQLDHIKVHHSSGYHALDEAALHALQQVEPQLELAQLTDANVLHRLPVSYRLVDSL